MSRVPSDPVWLRRQYLRSLEMLGHAEDIRREQAAAGASLQDRIAAASVVDTCRTFVAYFERELRLLARKGGRGLPPPGCRGSAPAAMAHGCAASSLVVGPTPAGGPAVQHNLPADPLLLGSAVQELPDAGRPSTVEVQP